MGDFMFFKTKASSIFSFFLFTIFFTLLLACGGGGSDKKNGNDSGSENPVVEDPIAEDPIAEDPIAEDPIVEDPILPPPIECPTGYIAVPSNSDVGVDNDFCVMKYEAKNEGAATTQDATDDIPVSKPEESPFWNISQNDARSACKNLNSESSDSDIDNDTGGDGTYALISNPEWMTIARNIENVDKNWTSGTVGTGCLFRGNVGATVPCQGVNSGYEKEFLGLDFGLERPDLAKLTLDNGEEIWDFSGNVNEFVDWNVAQADKAYVLADGSPINSFKEFTALDTNTGEDDVMSPNTWQPTNPTLDATNGIGRYNARGETHSVAIRGGDSGSISNAGVFALFFRSEANAVLFASFRCVYRP